MVGDTGIAGGVRAEALRYGSWLWRVDEALEAQESVAAGGRLHIAPTGR
jgi:uncharacterized protein (DUF1501 family)